MTEHPRTDPPKTTSLHGLHRELGARMVPFAGWEMPVQYPTGILAEHLHTRAAAGLFDVSHMGQIIVTGQDPAAAVERLVPADIVGLGLGRARYTTLMAEDGGILDDLIITKESPEKLFIVVNAGGIDTDLAHLRAALEPKCRVTYLSDQALLALQGPKAVACFSRLVPAVTNLVFMDSLVTRLHDQEIRVSRLGYTGEDGVEISVPAPYAVKLARTLLAMEDVKPVGLGARDSLRLEAGLCLYGHDIDLTTSPIEANLAWTIGRRRRENGGFIGAERVLRELADGPARRLIGVKPEGRAPAREGTEIVGLGGEPVGRITSGGFGPTVGGPIALGYVASSRSAPGSQVHLMVRGKPLAASIIKLPFSPHHYARRGA